MKRPVLIILVLVVLSLFGSAAFAGPYAPAAGVSGSTAVYKTDSAFVAWATGYQSYLPGANVSAGWQTPEKALGQAVGDSYDIVCLGDGGSIVLTFDGYIYDGDGWDFAVFENSFSNTFLELGYVEVSLDGITWYRFENDSQTYDPVSGFGSVDPTDIDGLAGKYKQGYGTPFDLSDLGLEYIAYVRIIDIIGDGSCLDSSGDPIYDPYPTSGSAGFDLDAVGVRYLTDEIAAVPIPAAVWLLGSGLTALAALRRKLWG